ncbi:MAG: class I SAM-dependent methyltransferase [Chloroflexota bacterium]
MWDPALLAQTAGVLEALADGRPALEFAIGTGRVAVPLAERGVAVTGIELDAGEVAKLRARGGIAAELPVVVGDMTAARAPGAGGFGLVYLVFNTIMNVTTQDAQVACFENAAAHLAPGGRFLVETMVPALRKLPPGERYVVFGLDEGYVGVDEYDVERQLLWSHHTTVTPDGRGHRSRGEFRFVWPAELDLMARIAGLRLVHRWADWSRAPFTTDSPAHVSVWEKQP